MTSRKKLVFIISFLYIVFLLGCELERQSPAPVVTLNKVKKAANKKTSVSRTSSKKAPFIAKKEINSNHAVKSWIWPAQGAVVKSYAAHGDNANKGVDIAGNLGDPVFAAKSGKIVYAGTGLRGYGKLVIIKHQDDFLSAYAHNQEILVKEGAQVVAGQKIGTMGKSDTHQVKLHFEIRKSGKPIDPLNYLPSRL